MAPHRHQSSLEEAIIDFSTRISARELEPNSTPSSPIITRHTIEVSSNTTALSFSVIPTNMRAPTYPRTWSYLPLLTGWVSQSTGKRLTSQPVYIPQPSPAPLSAVQRAIGGEQEYVETPDRLSTLRGACLIRDRYRCAISHKFDLTETLKRFKKHGTDAQDEEGNPLRGQSFDSLQVAHILPHALMKSGQDSQLSESKRATLNILDMFDHGVVRLIEGIDIDRPFNAISLSPSLHTLLGGFEIFFEPVPSQLHTYQVNPFLPEIFPDLPVTRTLYLSVDCTIDAPLPRFFAIHSAIAHTLHLSGAGEYIDEILRDLENIGVHGDGSTELGRLVMLRLGDWVDVKC
ncbi:hypothetical protein AJ79_03122 [Helicocarpus griseus UAMH5409]|uniref:HNH nuclease domain-containing protein n=1 Tax=Helicocarpus griseus UAMH5409 TaxID=1447875 RepID=A0A2B7XZ51_9EURO|nr:hypothetical protein AJ79_03122 [Helicocarpus griseus UAMH5409]